MARGPSVRGPATLRRLPTVFAAFLLATSLSACSNLIPAPTLGATAVRATIDTALRAARTLAARPASSTTTALPPTQPGAKPAPEVGEVTYYDAPRDGGSSLMVRVWNWRIYYGHVPECPECVDAVALVDPEHIGQKVWLRHPGGEVVGPVMVVDCAEAKHRANLRKRGWVADVSWELAKHWKMTGPLKGVSVLFEQPGRVDVTAPITRPTSCPAKGCARR